MTEPIVRLAMFREPTLARLATIERAVAAWSAGALTRDAREAAATEAHRLAGTLGMFGEEAGSDDAHQLELLLRSADATPAGEAHAAQCRLLVGVLRGRVEAALQRGAPGSRDGERVAASPSEEPKARPRPMILVADDDEVIAHLLTVTLGRQGYTIVRAYNGVEAIECVRTHPVDLVFMDVQMPQMDGLQACRILRDDPRHARLPIVIMTAQGGPNSDTRALAAGATVCLAKPFSVSHVRELARAWLDRAHGA